MQSIEDGQAAHEIRWKLPTAPANEVLREQLVDALCGPSGTRINLVHAPAGFGKTSLMLQCRARLAASGVRVVWLRFDAADNDGARFAASVDDAVRRTLAAPLPSSAAPARAIGPADALARIVRTMDASAVAFALFLDNFHHLTRADLLDWLSGLVELLPANGRLFIGTRTLPRLRLARIRARRDLTEVDAVRLRFSVDEVARLLPAQAHDPFEPADAARLHARTEGWPAALSLALAARSQDAHPPSFITRYSGAEDAVAPYLQECVLGGLPPEVMAFMQRTSILETLEPALCDRLVPGAGASQMLGWLQDLGLVVPAGPSGQARSYHALLKDLLRARLLRDHAATCGQLHEIASRWYEERLRFDAAIGHAVQGADAQRAVSLLATHAMRLLSEGLVSQLSDWLGRLPPAALAASDALMLVRCWSSCYAQGPSAAGAILAASTLQRSSDPRVAQHLVALRACMLAMMGRHEEAGRMAQAGLVRFPAGDAFARGALLLTLAMAAREAGQFEQARRHLDGARDPEAVGIFHATAAQTLDACIDWQEGHLRRAAARLGAAVRVPALQPQREARTAIDAWVALPYANTLYESGRLDEAAQLLHAHLPLVRTLRMPELLCFSCRPLARIAFWRGASAAALGHLAEHEHLGHAAGLDGVIAMARAERTHLLMMSGRLDDAREELERAEHAWKTAAGSRHAGTAAALETARLRWEVLAGNAAHAAQRLEYAASRAEMARMRRQSLRLRLLHAGARMRLGQAHLAMPSIESALRNAAAEGFRQLVLDESAIVAPAVRALHARFRQPGSERDAAFASYLGELADAMARWTGGTGDGHAHMHPAQPLSRTELVVLRLLAEGHSNTAMAQKLIVSDSTVRSHLRKIYSKLDVHSRTQAIAVSRQLGLIP